MGKKYGFSFSWKRAVGISAAKGKISKKIGVPLTRSGRQRKVGRAAGCLVVFASLIGMPLCIMLLLAFGIPALR